MLSALSSTWIPNSVSAKLEKKLFREFLWGKGTWIPNRVLAKLTISFGRDDHKIASWTGLWKMAARTSELLVPYPAKLGTCAILVCRTWWKFQSNQRPAPLPCKQTKEYIAQ